MRAAACILLFFALPALAREDAPAGPGSRVFDNVRVEIALTPGDEAAKLIIGTIASARREIYVQAFSFTHRAIAHALIDAEKRGVLVRVIADAREAERLPFLLTDLANAGIGVMLDAEHDAAHNKVMIFDPGTPAAAVLTGSYNFTYAAEFRNAENVVILRGNRALADAYLRNWLAHRAHSQPAPEDNTRAPATR